ncbi:MAG: tetratricopeptide repeat protein [Microbacteriaceae bacterium]|nr:tetratricopeptide repeat protein [Microbacteriaceae bacterium]
MTNQVPTNLRGAVDLTPLARKAIRKEQSGSESVKIEDLAFEATDSSFEQVVEVSSKVPVVVEFYANSPSVVLDGVIRGFQGRLVLATVDPSSNPALMRAFQITALPSVVAIIAGRPLPLYQGELGEDDAKNVFEQVLKVAAQNGIEGSIAKDKLDGQQTESEQPLPPHHQEAFDAIERGDFEGAIAAYKTALAQDPRDYSATVGIAQVSLLKRVSGKDAKTVREEAAAAPTSIEAQLAVADLDVAGGHLDDAFDRLLDLFPGQDSAGKEKIRVRLIEYFDLAGIEDERVVLARRRLTAMLY